MDGSRPSLPSRALPFSQDVAVPYVVRSGPPSPRFGSEMHVRYANASWEEWGSLRDVFWDEWRLRDFMLDRAGSLS